MLPPLNGLHAFEVVARKKSFALAAKELGVTASAVSHQVRNLEQFLGVELLWRSGADISMTEEGRTLCDYLGPAFSLIREGSAGVAARTGAVPLGVSLRPHFATRWLGRRMGKLWRKLPGLDIRFLHSNDPADFSDPTIHLSIEWLHVDAVPDHARLVWAGNLTPACSPELVKGSSKLEAPADLANHKLLHEIDERSWREWLAMTGCESLQSAGKLFYQDTNVRHRAVLAGEGVALVCPTLIEDDLRDGLLVRPFDAVLDTYAYYLVVPPGRLEIPAVKPFVDWLLEEAEAASFGAM